MDHNAKSIISNIKYECGVSYDVDTGAVSFSGSGDNTKHFASLFEYLFEIGILSKNDLPYSAKYSQTRYILNNEPLHDSGRMDRPYEIAEGVYLETNHNTVSKKRYSKKVIEDFVLE